MDKNDIIQIVALNYPVYALYKDYDGEGNPGFERILLAGISNNGMTTFLHTSLDTGLFDFEPGSNFSTYHIGELPDDWRVLVKS